MHLIHVHVADFYVEQSALFTGLPRIIGGSDLVVHDGLTSVQVEWFERSAQVSFECLSNLASSSNSCLHSENHLPSSCQVLFVALYYKQIFLSLYHESSSLFDRQANLLAFFLGLVSFRFQSTPKYKKKLISLFVVHCHGVVLAFRLLRLIND